MARGTSTRTVKYNLTAEQHTAVQAFLKTEQAADKTEKRFQKVAKSGRDVSRQMSSMRSAVMGLAAAYIGLNGARALGRFITNTVASADAVAKQSKAIGVSAEALQELSYAADRSGVSSEALNSGLLKLNKSIADAAQGGKASADIFRGLGVAIKQPNGELKSTDQILTEISDKFAKSEDSIVKVRTAMQLFGRGGAPMINLMNEGAEGLERLKNRARELDLVRSNKEMGDAETLNDAMGDVQKRFTAGIQRFVFANQDEMISLAEASVDILNKIFGGVMSILKWLPFGLDYQQRKAADEVVDLEKALKQLEGAPNSPNSQRDLPTVRQRLAEAQARLDDISAQRMGVGKYAPVDVDRSKRTDIERLIEEYEAGADKQSTAVDKNTRAVERLTTSMDKPSEEDIQRHYQMQQARQQFGMAAALSMGVRGGGLGMAGLMAMIPRAGGSNVRTPVDTEARSNDPRYSIPQMGSPAHVQVHINTANFASPAAALRQWNARTANGALGAF